MGTEHGVDRVSTIFSHVFLHNAILLELGEKLTFSRVHTHGRNGLEPTSPFLLLLQLDTPLWSNARFPTRN